MNAPSRIGIGLLGKGSTNHLHKQEIVNAFKAAGVEIMFLVREDYINLLTRLEGVEYRAIQFREPGHNAKRIADLMATIRWAYPASDKGRRVNDPPASSLTKLQRFTRSLCRMVAYSRALMHALLWMEERLLSPNLVQGVEAKSIDQLLLLGVGTVNSELEAVMTRWAVHHGIPTIHFVGNYDNLSSKGFRGVSVQRLLVWGPSMVRDAVTLHGIPENRIKAIGSLRYNSVIREQSPSRSDFLQSIGLKPGVPTILFAGFVMEYNYFEILSVLQMLRKEGTACQLILRIYPNKHLLNSVYMEPMRVYAATIPGVYVSIGDPHYLTGQRDREVLQIEEHELMNSLRHCDLVVNQYSTISVESSMFDKPTINMWYFAPANRAMRAPLEVLDFPQLYHNRRMDSYGAVPRATTQEELSRLIKEALANPGLRAGERRNVVENEIGVLDGKASQRLVAACVAELTVKR